MKLDAKQLATVQSFLSGELDSLPEKILKEVELAVWTDQIRIGSPGGKLFASDQDLNPDLSSSELTKGQFGQEESLFLLNKLKNGKLRYLMIRVNSWACALNCDGKLIYRECEETIDDTVKCCEKLNKSCEAENW